MNLYIRIFILLFKHLFHRGKVDPFAPWTTSFRVNLLDLDFNFHMNNGRYLSVMDLGRVDLLLKAGAVPTLLKGGYYPVVSSESIRFRKSLGLFERFDVVTCIEAWDEKDFYIRQTFIRNGQLCAEGVIKGRFLQRGHKGSVSTRKLFQLLKVDYFDSPPNAMADTMRHMEKQLANPTRAERTP